LLILFWPWSRRQHVPLKCGLTFNRLWAIWSQKTELQHIIIFQVRQLDVTNPTDIWQHWYILWYMQLMLGIVHKKKELYESFEVFMAVTMKNGVFWDVTPCGTCKNRRFSGT
jgi:hypothetical protein